MLFMNCGKFSSCTYWWNFTSHSILIKAHDVQLYRWPTQRNYKLNHICISRSMSFLLPLLLTHQGRLKMMQWFHIVKIHLLIQPINNVTVERYLQVFWHINHNIVVLYLIYVLITFWAEAVFTLNERYSIMSSEWTRDGKGSSCH